MNTILKIVIVLVIVIFLISTVLGAYILSHQIEQTSTSLSTKNAFNFSFSDSAALSFLENLSTPSGLLETFPSSQVIYLSDDQQLDYAAILKLGDVSGAELINSTMQAYGGLFGNFSDSKCILGNWNGVDVVIGKFVPIPCMSLRWNLFSGHDISANSSKLPNSSGYQISQTLWNGSMGSDYVQYADLEVYYCLNELQFRNYSEAIGAFQTANSYWDGNGFADVVYKDNTSNGYASYKLALDLIAFDALMNNPQTESAVVSYASILGQVQSVMSKLQSTNGGVTTNYQVMNGQILIPRDTYENGETTSLFVLAY